MDILGSPLIEPVRFLPATYTDEGTTKNLRIPEYINLEYALPTDIAVICNNHSPAVTAPGLYINRGDRWIFALNYSDIQTVFTVHTRVAVFINPQTPVDLTGTSLVYRNSYRWERPADPAPQEQVFVTVTIVVDTGGGPTVGVDAYYEYQQASASASWFIQHNLGKYPSVSIFDSAQDEVEGEVKYLSKNALTVTFSAPMSGTAALN